MILMRTLRLEAHDGQETEDEEGPLDQTHHRFGSLPLQDLEKRHVQNRPARKALHDERAQGLVRITFVQMRRHSDPDTHPCVFLMNQFHFVFIENLISVKKYRWA